MITSDCLMADNAAGVMSSRFPGPMPAYSKVSCFKLYQEEFEKTPKRSIKRYLYQPAEEN